MNNQFNILDFLRSGGNPKSLAMELMQKQAGNNPMMQNLLGLAQQGNTAEIERIARNLCASRGLDFDKEFNAFKQQFRR